MHNVTHSIKGGKLIIEVDISAKALDAAPASSSGKTYLVATTGGAMPVPLENGKPLSFSINVMTKK